MNYPVHLDMTDKELKLLIFYRCNEFDEDVDEAEALEASKVLIGRTDKRIAEYRERITELEAELDEYHKAAQTRVGWQGE